MIRYQKMKLVRSVLVDALVPSLVFAGFVFMPLGVGLAVVAAGFALMIVSHYILKRYEPKAGKLPSFDEHDYTAFEQRLLLEDKGAKKCEDSHPRALQPYKGSSCAPL